MRRVPTRGQQLDEDLIAVLTKQMRLVAKLLLGSIVGVLAIGIVLFFLPKHSKVSEAHPLSPGAKMLLQGQWKIASPPQKFRDGRVYVEYDPLEKTTYTRFFIGYTYTVYHDDHLLAADLEPGQIVIFEETDSRDPQLTDSDVMKYVKVKVVH